MTSGTALAAFINARTRDNRDSLFAAYSYLCNRAAKKFYRRGVDRADLVQVAAVGLIKAVEHYDPHERTPFEAYAWLLVIGELMHYVRDHERSVRVPRKLRALEKQFAGVDDSLSEQLGRPANVREIATELGVDIAVADEVRLLRQGGTVISLEAATCDLPAATHGLKFEDRCALFVAIQTLAERERTVVLGSFAAGLSQAELGVRLGLSQSQVSKLIKKALVKLHRHVA